jgi:hypothetical protein
MQQFRTTCARVGEAARNAGLTLAKAPTGHSLVISKDGKSVSFPIVTDDRDWRETSPEEALYAVILDTNAWASANTDPSMVASLQADAVQKSEVPLIDTDRKADLDRLRELISVAGDTTTVKTLWIAAGFDGAALSGAGIS